MDLHLEVDGDEIVVTRPETDFELVYGRPKGERNLVVKRSWVPRTVATPAINDFAEPLSKLQPPRRASLGGLGDARNPAATGTTGSLSA